MVGKCFGNSIEKSIPRIRLGKYLRFDPIKISNWIEAQSITT